MKLTKSQLRKLVNEEVEKVYEIDASGRSAWDPANVKKREKEVRRLGKDKIAQLRRAAEEDQRDRAKSPRFKKPVNEEDDGDIPVFAGPEVIEMPSFQANREKEEASKAAAMEKADENWELVLEMLPDEVDKETFKEKVMEAIIYKATEDLGYFSYEGDPPPSEYFRKMHNMKIPKWQRTPNRWAPANDEDDRRTFSNWWLNVVAPGIFHVLGSRHDIYDYAKRWQIEKEEAKEAELNRKVSVVDTDPDFMKGWFKEGKIRKSLLTKIVKEEFKKILSEFSPNPQGGGDGYLSWDIIADMYIRDAEHMTKKLWTGPDQGEWYSGHHFPVKYPLYRAKVCFAAMGEFHSPDLKKKLRDRFIEKGVLPKSATIPPVSFFEKILKHFDDKFGLIGDPLGDHNCGKYYNVKVDPDASRKRAEEEYAQERGRHNVTSGKIDKLFKEGKDEMKLTTKQLAKIIKEEVQSVLKETERVPTIPEFIMSLAGEEGYEPSVDREKQERGESDWFKMGAKHILSNFYMPIPPEERKVADEVFYELIQQGESSENIETRTYVALQNKMDEPGRKEKGLPAYPPHSYRFDTLWLVLREILEFVESASGGDSE